VPAVTHVDVTRPPSPGGSGLRRAVHGHLGSRDVARVVYGSILGLAFVVALGQHPPSAAQAVGGIIATAVAVALAEVYSEYVGEEARERRRPGRKEVRVFFEDAAAVAFGAGFPAVFFVLSAVGLIEVDLAFKLAKWTGLGLICAYGFAAARLAGLGVGRALMHMAVVGAVGVALIVAKALLH
jgi:hypothetical protein